MKNSNVVRLFEGGRFSARELETAVYEDAEVIADKFFGMYLSEEMKQWRDECNANEVLAMLFKCSFMYGACGTFDTYQKEMRFEDDLRRVSSKSRPRMFAQAIVPNKELRSWIDETGCIDFIYALYEESYIFGGEYMIKAIKFSNVMFEKDEQDT